jgi:predicted alpha/beta-fold hydrolase
LASIRWPTLILASQDDPLIPYRIFAEMPKNDAVQLHTTAGGGHLGFIGRGGADRDRRWLDWRIVEWITSRR